MRRAPPRDRRGSRGGGSALGIWVPVAAAHLLLAFAMTFPAALHAGTDLFGAPRGDKYLFLWNFWWVKHALLDLHQLPFYTTLQYHPTGVSLALHDMAYFWSLVAVPLQLFLDPAVVLDLLLLVALPLNGLAFFRLAKEVTGSGWGALAGSIVFAYCPYQLARFGLGQISLNGVFFVPLFFLSLWRYRRDRRGAHLMKAGVWLALQSLCSWYFGVAMGGVLLFFLAGCAIRAASRRSDAPSARRLALHAVATGLVAGALLAPFVAPILLAIHRGEYGGATHRAGHQYLEASSGDLASYFLPNPNVAAWRGWALSEALSERQRQLVASLRGNRLEKTVYPGWISWMALLAALASGTLRRRQRPWIAVALSFFVLSLGPTLTVWGRPYLDGLLPARLLAHLPVLNIIRGPVRFAPFMTLGTGVLLAATIARIRDRRGARMAMGVAIGCALASCAEFLPDPVNHFPSDTWRSPFYRTLRADDSGRPILDVPVDFHGALGGGDIYGFAQTLHHRPRVGGYVSREPDGVLDPLEGSAFLRAVAQRQYQRDKRLRLDDAGLADMHRTLRTLGVQYVLVHRALLPGGEWPRVTGWLERGLGPPRYEDRWIRVYAAPAP